LAVVQLSISLFAMFFGFFANFFGKELAISDLFTIFAINILLLFITKA